LLLGVILAIAAAVTAIVSVHLIAILQGRGLSLASAVARLHHGALRLDDNEPGLRVTIDLPSGEAAKQ
jgi:two-component sensor histidine kinase